MNITNEIIESINKIDQVTMEAEYNVICSLCNAYTKQAMIMEYYQGNDINQFTVFQEGFKDMINNAKGDSSEKMIIRILKFIPRLIMSLIKTIKNSWDNRKSQQLIKRIEALEKLSQEQREKIDELVKSSNNSNGSLKSEIKINKNIDDIKQEISEINRKIDIIRNTVKTDLNFPELIKFFEDILEAFSILEKWDFNKPSTMNKKSINKLSSLGIKMPELTKGQLKTYDFDDIKKYSGYIIDLYEQISRRGSKIQERFSNFIDDFEKSLDKRKPTPAQTERFNVLVSALKSTNGYINLGKRYANEVGKSFNKLSEEFDRYSQFVNKI